MKKNMMNLVSKLSTLNTKLIVFDLDGTLYNKRGLSLRMVLHAPMDIRKMQAERATRASMKGMWLGDEKHFYETFFQRMAARMHCSATAAEQWYNQRYMPLMVKMIGKYQPLSEWVMPFIAECKEKGVKMVVLSDYEYAEEKLRALGLNPELFDWVASAPLLGGLKPAPELMYIITERMGVAPQDCLVIGDRDDTDGEMARRTGAQFRKV
jgi:HAD superfamily hydrolase (TIGR01549 family)